MRDSSEYEQHPRFGTQPGYQAVPGFIDTKRQHCDGGTIARLSGLPEGARIQDQICAVGLWSEFQKGFTPWMLPISWNRGNESE